MSQQHQTLPIALRGAFAVLVPRSATRVPMRRALAGAAILLAMALASCGGNNGASGKAAASTNAAGDSLQIRANVERVFNDFYAASLAGDDRTVCRHVTAKYARSLIANFAGDTCEEAVRNARKTNRAPLDARPRYSAFSTAGQTARIRVIVSSDEGHFTSNLTFRYVDDEWKIDSFGAR